MGLTGCAATGMSEPPPVDLDSVSLTAAAIGSPQARAAAGSIVIEQSGLSYPTDQAWDPANPIGEAGRFYRWRIDADEAQLIREAEQRFPGGIRFWSRIALSPAGGWNIDLIRWRTGDDLLAVGAQDALQTRLQWERLVPHLLVRQASTAGVVSNTAAGFGYTDAAGAVIEVTVDQETRLPTKVEQLNAGVVQSAYHFFDYEPRHGVMMPRRVQVFGAGRLQEEVSLGSTRIAAVPDLDLVPPAAYAPPPAAGAPDARELSPGVFYFDDMPGGYHSMAFDMGDHVVLAEAPQSPAYAETQRAILERVLPGKPVRYVLVSHHHGDHTGGLSAWAASGATIIVPAGSRVAIERQLRARSFTGDAKIEEVSGRRSFGVRDARIDAYTVASSHSAANLLVHSPKTRLLFQGDFFYVPARGAVPPEFEIVSELRAAIKTLALDVDQVAGVHGRIADAAELRASQDFRESGSRD
jgi:glyoxylase-like metal-dependent hydrolase (beta-lactamase superfamily II)